MSGIVLTENNLIGVPAVPVIRQQVVNAVETLLKTIITGQTVGMSDGTAYTYVSDISSGRVFELGETDYPKDQPYAVFWHDLNADADNSENGRTLWSIDLSFLLLAKTGKTDQVRTLAQDILAALFSDKRLGGLTTTMTVRRLGDPKIERFEHLIGDLELIVTLYYRTKDWQI